MAAKAKQNKTIQITIYFFTKDLNPEADKVLPRHAWDCGQVTLPANKLHGIRAGGQKRFRTLMHLGHAIEELLRKNRIILHAGRGSRKYMSWEAPRKKIAN